jgi:excisionase family DNA binding protein
MAAVGEQLLSLVEAAQRCGFAVSTFREMRRHGRGPESFRIGNRVRIRESELERWLSEAEEAERARRTGRSTEQENTHEV